VAPADRGVVQRHVALTVSPEGDRRRSPRAQENCIDELGPFEDIETRLAGDIAAAAVAAWVIAVLVVGVPTKEAVGFKV